MKNSENRDVETYMSEIEVVANNLQITIEKAEEKKKQQSDDPISISIQIVDTYKSRDRKDWTTKEYKYTDNGLE